MTTCVSGGTCMSRSNLRLGTSEGESDALFGKGSGSNGRLRRGRVRRARWAWRCELAEQAVAFEAVHRDRQDMSDNGGGGHDVGRLQIGGAADDLAGISAGTLKQHIDGGTNRSRIEGRLLAVDQLLKPHQSLVHISR